VPERRRWLRLARVPLAVLAGFLVVLLALGAWLQRAATRRWLAGEIASRAAAALGQPVALGDVELSFLPLRLTAHDLAVGPQARPVLRIASAGVTLRTVRLREREVVLDSVFADGVRVDLALPARLPESSAAAPWVRVVLAHLEVRHLTVDRVELPSGIFIEASDAEASMSARSDGTVRAAVARIGRLEVHVPGGPTISGAFAARGRQTATGWELGRLRARGAWWSLVASAESARDGALAADGEVELDLGHLDEALGIGAGLTGTARAAVSVALAGDALRASASVASPALAVAGFSLADVAATVKLDGGSLEATLERATFAGGAVAGSYSLARLGAPWRHRVALRTRGGELDALLRTIGVDAAGLAARCTITSELAWDGLALAAGHGSASVELAPVGGDVPVAGTLAVTLEGDGRLHLTSAGVALAGAPVTWQGTLALDGWLPSWSIHAERLPTAAIARMLRGWTGAEVLPAGLHAEVSGDLQIEGPFSALSIRGRVAAAPLALGALAVDSANATFALAGGVATVEAATVSLAGGHADLAGTLRLGDGALDLDVNGTGFPLARLLALAGQTLPAAGTLDLAASVAGTLAAPRAEARLRATGVAIAGVPLGDGHATVRLGRDTLHLDGLALGPLSAAATLDLAAGTLQLDADVAGLDLGALSPELAALAGGPIDAAVHGSFPLVAPDGVVTIGNDHGLAGSVRIEHGRIEAELERPGVLRVEGELAPAGDGLAGEVRATLPSLRGLVVALEGAELPFDGAVAAHASVGAGPGGALRLDGTLDRVTLELESERVDLSAPARFSWHEGAFRLDHATLSGPRSHLALSYAVAADGTLASSLEGSAPAALLALVWPDGKPRGTLELAATLGGTAAEPRMTGRVQVRDGALTLPGLPAPLTAINGTLSLGGGAATIEGLTFDLGEGDVSCSGRIAFRPALELDLGVHAEGVAWKLLPRFAPVLSGDLRVSGPLDRLLVSGDVTVVEAEFSGQLDIDAIVLKQLFAPERAALRSSTPVGFNILVHIPGTFDIDTLPLRLQARGELRLVGTSERLGLLGRVEALPGGEAEVSGQQYELDRAAIAFSQPDRIEPAFDVVARAWVDNVEVTVALAGTPQRVVPTFTSNPPMSPTDILSLLSSGSRSVEGQPESVSAAASKFLNNQLAGAVSSRARSLLNVDQLRLDPAAATSTGDAATRMTVVKQVGRGWMVSVSSNLSSNREEAVHSVWRVGQGLLIDAARQSDGSYSLGFKWQRRY
jgi:autotransporter translocation and assembly factor TamB